jgi:hypothetical protein
MTEPQDPEKPPEPTVDLNNDPNGGPNDSDARRDRLKGQTTQHADPPRLEDEGQSGG